MTIDFTSYMKTKAVEKSIVEKEMQALVKERIGQFLRQAKIDNTARAFHHARLDSRSCKHTLVTV